MDGLEIVDAHMHLWTPTTHPWVEKVRGGGHPAGNFGEHKLCVIWIMDSGWMGAWSTIKSLVWLPARFICPASRCLTCNIATYHSCGRAKIKVRSLWYSLASQTLPPSDSLAT